MAFLISFEHPPWTVTIEDDDRVAYAYLLSEGQIQTDVWLANAVLPAEAEWKLPDARERLPFLNPVPYVDPRSGGVRRYVPGDLSVQWSTDPGGTGVAIFDGHERIASMHISEKPGRCLLAVADGPLARTLSPGASR